MISPALCRARRDPTVARLVLRTSVLRKIAWDEVERGAEPERRPPKALAIDRPSLRDWSCSQVQLRLVGLEQSCPSAHAAWPRRKRSLTRNASQHAALVSCLAAQASLRRHGRHRCASTILRLSLSPSSLSARAAASRSPERRESEGGRAGSRGVRGQGVLPLQVAWARWTLATLGCSAR
jgi:hypothetical protein